MIKTIGHSNHPIGRFVDLLKAGGVEAVVDVRSTPYSRRFPQFGRERLAQSLSAAGILYRYEGAALGGKPKDGAGYDELAERGAEIEHLLADGSRKPHAVLEEEMLGAGDDGAPDLFTTAEDRGQRLAQAYQKRERAMKRA